MPMAGIPEASFNKKLQQEGVSLHSIAVNFRWKQAEQSGVKLLSA